MALAHIRGQEAFSLLSTQFKQKRNEEIRRAAAYGLGVIGGSEVRRLLEPGARSTKSELSQAGRQVLSKMR